MFWGYDARNLLDFLPKRPFVTSIITSPPYFNLKDYGHKEQIGFHARTIEEYLGDLETVFEQCHRILKDEGTLWVVSDCMKMEGELIPLPFLIAERLQRHKWILQDIVIWRKDKTLPFSFRGRFRNLFEYIYVYSKTRQFKFRAHRILARHKDESRLYKLNGNEARFLRGWPERYAPLGANPGDVWDIPIPIQGTWNPHRINGNGDSLRIHYCPFPQELVSRIIQLSTDPGDIVLDPFAGSGSVAAQSELMRRRFIGVEINPDYKNAYNITCQNFTRSSLKASSIQLADQQDRLEEGELILKLRQVKHASVWGRLISETLKKGQKKKSTKGGSFLLAIITIGRVDRSRLLRDLIEMEQPKSVSYPVDVYLLFSRVRNVKLLDQMTKQKLAEQFLRKYGLKIQSHILNAADVTTKCLGLEPDSPVSLYDPKRFFQCANTITAKTLCSQLRKLTEDGRVRELRFIASDAHIAASQKKNVIEEVVKRFVSKFAKTAIDRLGGKERAAEFLGMTRGELHRLFERTPAG